MGVVDMPFKRIDVVFTLTAQQKLLQFFGVFHYDGGVFCRCFVQDFPNFSSSFSDLAFMAVLNLEGGNAIGSNSQSLPDPLSVWLDLAF